MGRDVRFELRLSEREHTKLHHLAEAKGLSMADVLRVFINEAHTAAKIAEHRERIENE